MTKIEDFYANEKNLVRQILRNSPKDIYILTSFTVSGNKEVFYLNSENLIGKIESELAKNPGRGYFLDEICIDQGFLAGSDVETYQKDFQIPVDNRMKYLIEQNITNNLS